MNFNEKESFHMKDEQSKLWMYPPTYIQMLLLKWANPGLFFIYFRLFKHTLQFLQQINVKNVHLVYGAGIQTHDLWNMSLLP